MRRSGRSTPVPGPSTLAGMRIFLHSPGRAFAVLASVSTLSSAAPVAMPSLTPDSTGARAPLRVTLRCATADASIYVTLDGQEPTNRDTELESGATILLDEPCTLKARAMLPDGRASAVKIGVFPLTPVPGFGASFVEQDVPEAMATGARRRVSVVLRNIGTSPWNPEEIVLVPRRASDAAIWGAPQAAQKEAVGTWKTAAFNFQITAPAAPGTYNFQWHVRDADGRVFGEATPVVRIRVVPPDQLAALNRNGAPDGGPRHADRAPAGAKAPDALPANVARLAAAQRVKPGSDLERLVRALAWSGHSFKALRERGFKQSDAEFEKIIADHPGLFRSTRIIRRDEQGRRLIPGWPAITLKL